MAHLQRQAAALNHPDTFAQVRLAYNLGMAGPAHSIQAMDAVPLHVLCTPLHMSFFLPLPPSQSAKAERKAIALAKELAKLQEQSQVSQCAL